MKRLILSSFFLLAVFYFSKAQQKYEPIHGASGYDYCIKGTLELAFTHFVDLKNGTKSEETYRIKSPVSLIFNLNDLKFFKAQPKEFIGYIENQYDAFSGYSSGSLIDIQQETYEEKENQMWIDEHIKWWEDGKLTELKAHGEIDPVLKVHFSIPDYLQKYKAGLGQLEFRITINISGNTDDQRNVVIEYDNRKQRGDDTTLMDETSLKELEQAYPSTAAEIKEGLKLVQISSTSHPSALYINVGCGAFYGSDLGNAEMSTALLVAKDTGDLQRKKIFERQFEQMYFKDMPHINVMKLINFLLNPVGNYETPIVGSFSSDSKNGFEKATYNGTLRLHNAHMIKIDN